MEASEQEKAIVDWLRRQLGAEVTRIERQPRWRPAWFVDAERGSESLRLYVRGERIDALDYHHNEYFLGSVKHRTNRCRVIP